MVPAAPFLRACRREPTSFTPIWLMRQAGRFMGEYRAVRERLPFLTLCKTSEAAAEVTLQPVEKLGVDAAILFADILLVLEPLGLGLAYERGDGPVLHEPIRSPDDVSRLPSVDVEDALAYVFETVRLVKRGLAGRVPLIGFAGAPFTLASYAIEAGGSRNYLRTKHFMYAHPDAWHALLARLVEVTARYLNGQIAAGADAVQLFDSWVGHLAPDDYLSGVLPHMQALFAKLTPGVPVIHFGTGTAGILELMRDAGGDVIGVDWRVSLDAAWRRIGDTRAIQGNLDPAALLAPIPTIREKVRRILGETAGRPGHVFNLGHGILPETPVDHVRALVDCVHELSDRRPA
jgi:uroporphyrinogen decarboxylase